MPTMLTAGVNTPLDLVGGTSLPSLSLQGVAGASATSITLNVGTGETVAITGAGFTFGTNGIPVTGTITGIELDQSGAAQVSLTGLNLSVATLAALVNGGGAADVGALLQALGPLQETGSNLNDSLAGLDGSDTLIGGDGNDLLIGDANAVGHAAALVSSAAGGGSANASVYGGVLSPSGTTAIFSSDEATNLTSGGSQYGFYTKDLGTGALTFHPTSFGGTQLSPFSFQVSSDGNTVAFFGESVDATGSSHYHVYSENLTTGVITQADANAAGVSGASDANDFSLSADGTVIAVSSYDNLAGGNASSNANVFIKTLSTGAVTGLAASEAVFSVAISPDNASVAFVASDFENNSEADHIAFENLQTGVVTPGPTIDGYGYDLAFSSNGKELAFVVQSSSGARGIYVDDVATGATIKVVDDDSNSYFSSVFFFTPDGKELIYQTQSSSHEYQLSSVDISSLKSQVLVEDPRHDGTLYLHGITPDGSKLLVGSTGDLIAGTGASGHNEYYLVNVSASAPAADSLVGGAGEDTLLGSAGADTLTGGYGSDTIWGGDGNDAALYNGFSHDYTLALSAGAGTVAGGPEGGTDTLSSVENVQFLDGTLTFDPGSTAAEIVRLYDSFLGRGPDPYGFDSYLNFIGASHSFEDAADLAAASPEFQQATAGLSDADYVTYVYEHSLHRAPDAYGLQQYEAALANHTLTRTSLIVQAAESPEHVALTAGLVAAGLWVPNAQVESLELLYDAAVQRAPDGYGLQQYGALIANGASYRDIANQMAGSAEFLTAHAGQDDAAFVQSLYQAELGRGADPGGLAAYTDQLAHGYTRGDILYETAFSLEHQSHVLAFADPLLG